MSLFKMFISKKLWREIEMNQIEKFSEIVGSLLIYNFEMLIINIE